MIDSVWFVEVHVDHLPPSADQLLSQPLGSRHEGRDVWVKLRDERSVGRGFVDDQTQFATAVTDRTPELLIRRSSETPQDQATGGQLGQ